MRSRRDALAIMPNLQPAPARRRLEAGHGQVMNSSAYFGPNPGRLERLLYEPARLEPKAPLVVLLHGCGQEAAAFAESSGWLTLADRLRFAVLAPRQLASNNPNRCFNWFLREDSSRGAGEAASIATMVTSTAEGRGLDASRVFIAGLSAGGAMALAMLASYPELFAGGAVFGALPYGVASDLAGAMRAMHQGSHLTAAELGGLPPTRLGGEALPPLTIWHGGLDAVVNPANGRAIAAQWALAQGLSETPDESEAAGGRSHSLWLRRGGREIAVELNIIDGLGHGVPLATRGPDGLGRTAPFMLEAGVSSSLEVARFWGLAPAEQWADQARPAPNRVVNAVALARVPPTSRLDAGPSEGIAARVLEAVDTHAPSGVRETIAKALRAAGLMH